jgi:hypothetical protein
MIVEAAAVSIFAYSKYGKVGARLDEIGPFRYV